MKKMNTIAKQLLQAITIVCIADIIIALQACNAKQSNDETAENGNLRGSTTRLLSSPLLPCKPLKRA